MNSETKFTQGPWTVEICESDDVIDVYADDECAYHPVADCRGNVTCRPVTEQMANAALIAAAPDMYSTLSVIIDMAKDATNNESRKALLPKIETIARAALAKARGDS